MIMKFSAFFLLVMCICFFGDAQSPRQSILIDREWKFFLGEKQGAEAIGFNDKEWNDINIPHNFSMPYFQASRWYVGDGWYRKHLSIPTSWKDKSVSIEFEGAFREAEIFLNGIKVGEHNSGYTGFTIDISKTVHTGDNILAIRLSNRWNARLAPRCGDHNFTGGIYRDVYLVATNKTHVTWYGTFVTTPKLTKDAGIVQVETEVANQTSLPKTVQLKSIVLDATGKQVDEFTSTQEIPANGIFNFKQLGHFISNPNLWHPSHPYLYKVVSKLMEGNKLLDTYLTSFGFRWMEWTADKGYFLNGEHYYFKGANVHQDHAGWASAATNTAITRDVKMVKEAGFDFIRGSHYPHDPSFADACDSLGILFWSENNFWSSGGFGGEGSWFKGSGVYPIKQEDRNDFEESVKTSLTEMIRINRNHPSIITWSMSNEPFFTADGTLPFVRDFLKRLVDLAHQLDPSRKIAVGGVQRGELDKTGDIAGYNGDGARLFINPGVPNVVSEYGSTVAEGSGKYEPGFGDMASQPLFPWRSGQAIWCAFDYGTCAGNFGFMGIINYQRIPKKAWYWYRNEYLKIPPPEWPKAGTPATLQLSADKTIIEHADGTDDIHLLVTVVDANGKPISNSPDITLTLLSGPGEFPTGSSITFSKNSEVKISEGKAAIEFRSYYASSSVIKASSPGLKDAFITIVSKNAPSFKVGKSIKVTERPYQKFVETKVATNKAVPYSIGNKTNLAFNKPTKASSEDAAHTGRYANDQEQNTYWSANSNQVGEWFQIDLENTLVVSKVKLVFPNEGNYSYKIELNTEGNKWVNITDQRSNSSSNKAREHLSESNQKGRFLRITFTGLPEGKKASLAELEIYGSE